MSRPAGRADVYDLTIEGVHEFFADGVLVHNCSGLVAYAAGKVGVPFPGTSGSQIAACIPISVDQAVGTRGALLWHEGHIAISLGNGQTVEAANPGVGVVSYNAAGRFAKGGKIPGMAY